MAFYRTDSSGYVFGGTISDTGSVDILGGKTIFTANQNYNGLTTIHGGATLQLGNNTSTGSIIGDVANDGTLAFNRSTALTYAGKISNTGGVTQAGSGTTVLSGSNTYSGATNVNAGVLSVSADSNLGTGSSRLSSAAAHSRSLEPRRFHPARGSRSTALAPSTSRTRRVRRFPARSAAAPASPGPAPAAG